jgi:hypothetical protein
MSNRTERLREYARPLRKENWQGAGRDQGNIDRWIARASENSDGADHRASSGEVQLPSTGKRQESRPTKMGPRVPRKINSVMGDARSDVNHFGSDYMKSIRRDA